jgi:hypothetical protein
MLAVTLAVALLPVAVVEAVKASMPLWAEILAAAELPAAAVDAKAPTINETTMFKSTYTCLIPLSI